MKKALLVFYAPAQNNSFTLKGVNILKELLNQQGISFIEQDISNNHPALFNSASIDAYVQRNFKKELLSIEQQELLEPFDKYARQVELADFVFLATPMYNFSVPAAVKAWIDAVAQAGIAFRYTKTGPEGLFTDKHAVGMIMSGGVGLNSARNFASGLLKTNFEFFGMKYSEIGIYNTRNLLMIEEYWKQFEKDLSSKISALNYA